MDDLLILPFMDTNCWTIHVKYNLSLRFRRVVRPILADSQNRTYIYSRRCAVVSASTSHPRGRVFKPHWLTSWKASVQKVLRAPNQVPLQWGHRLNPEMRKEDGKSIYIYIWHWRHSPNLVVGQATTQDLSDHGFGHAGGWVKGLDCLTHQIIVIAAEFHCTDTHTHIYIYIYKIIMTGYSQIAIANIMMNKSVSCRVWKPKLWW